MSALTTLPLSLTAAVTAKASTARMACRMRRAAHLRPTNHEQCAVQLKIRHHIRQAVAADQVPVARGGRQVRPLCPHSGLSALTVVCAKRTARAISLVAQFDAAFSLLLIPSRALCS